MSIYKTRQLLVDCAREIFARQGFDATTMNDIALASGKGRRTLYTYFKNKEEIYEAVISTELERMSERMDDLCKQPLTPIEKILTLVYTHLAMMKETVSRNGSLRAEFFRNIWLVERVRRKLDVEEKGVILHMLEEGVERGDFEVESLPLMADIILYSIKGLEVPYIYDRIGEGLGDMESQKIVTNILSRVLLKGGKK
ncbi:MAG: TetR/AcrR family transcriptional regulator [Bacteroidaceae bacterium]|jgi:AcrR family transcriptional regulator|nr:TetR/AcrR family transcriptional regulator [Bacteroidaceae bacterium]